MIEFRQIVADCLEKWYVLLVIHLYFKSKNNDNIKCNWTILYQLS